MNLVLNIIKMELIEAVIFFRFFFETLHHSSKLCDFLISLVLFYIGTKDASLRKLTFMVDTKFGSNAYILKTPE